METFEQLVQILHETSKKPTKTRKTSKHASSYAISGNQMLVLEEPIFPTNALLDQKDALLAQILQHSMNNTPFPTSLISAVSHYNQSAQGFSGSVPPPASYSPQPTFGPIPPSPFLPLPTLTTTTQSSGPPPLFTTPPSFPISTIPPPPPPPFAPDYFSVFEIMLKQLEDDLGITIGALTNKLNATLDKFEVSHPTKSMSWKVWASEKTAWLHFCKLT